MATRQQTLVMLMLIAFAFTASTMTALRISGVPIGIAEMVLAVCMLVHLPLGQGIHGGNAPNFFVPALFLLLLAMLPGYFATLAANGIVPFALYNLVASAWVVLLFAYVHFGFDHSRGEVDLLIRLFLTFSTVYFALIVLLAWFEPTMVYLQTEHDILPEAFAGGPDGDGPIFRLTGFSTNPNQLALHALVCSFLTLQLWKSNGSVRSLVCFVLAMTCGLMAKSDAFLFAEIALVAIWVTMGIVFGGSVILGLVLILPGIVAAVVLFRPVVYSAQEIASQRDQNSLRYELWENGILAGLERPLIGLGPGAWSGFDGPRGSEEAHNSVIDYFSNAGLLGVTLLSIGIVYLLYRSFMSKQAAMLAGTTAILLFAMFHNVLRQPIMWLGLYYVAQHVWPGGARRATSRRRRRSRRSRSTSAGLPV